MHTVAWLDGDDVGFFGQARNCAALEEPAYGKDEDEEDDSDEEDRDDEDSDSDDEEEEEEDDDDDDEKEDADDEKADKADAEARAASRSDVAERDKATGGLLERLDLGREDLRYFVFRSASATGWFRRLLAYDLFAFVSIVLVFGALHAWAWTEGLMTTGRQLREAVWWARCMYGLSALPYLVFSVPLLNRILTHTRPTGYDRDGRCVRKLSTPWKHRTTAPSRETGKGDAVDAAAAEPDEGSHEGSGADGGADATGPYATTVPVEHSADQFTEM